MSERAAIKRASVEITPVSWEPQGELSFEEWRQTGGKLGRIARATQWWIGDWLNYGMSAYGEKYTRALEDTGYELQSLMNMTYVASRFEISRRREILSWSHHAEVAPLELEEADQLLDQAAMRGWSRKDLRRALRSRNNGTRGRGKTGLKARVLFEAEFPNQQLLQQTVAALHERAKELGFTNVRYSP